MKLRSRPMAVAFAAGLAVLTLGFSGCAAGAGGSTTTSGSASSEEPTSSDDKEFTVGVVGLDASQPTSSGERKAFVADAQAIGWKVLEVNSNGVVSQAIAAMQNFVQAGVDVIIVQAYEPSQLALGLETAKAADIPVFLSAGGPFGEGMAGSVSVINAEVVNEEFIKYFGTEQKVELLALTYNLGAPGRVRQTDLEERLAGVDNVNVTKYEVPIPGAQEAGQEATAGWLQSHADSPDTALAIWPSFLDPGLGAIAAQKQLGRGPYTMFTWDVSQPALEAVREGYLTGVLWINVGEAAQQMIDLVTEWRDTPDKSTWEPKDILAGSQMITEDNIDQMLDDHPELNDY